MTKQWTCPTCGEKFPTDIVGKDHPRINHLREHTPSPAQWTEAYAIIQRGRDSAKEQAKRQPSA